MSLQLSVGVRNARLDQIESTIGTSAQLRIFSGAVPANCAAADPSGKLVEMALPSDWMNNAASGSKTLLGTWSVAATGAGTAASFRVYDTAFANCHIQGTVGQGSGDLSLDNTNIANGQTVTITTFTLTDGNA